MQVLISDANILIDLEDGLLLEHIFSLPYQFKVPDILFEEELKEYHGHLIEFGLVISELMPDSVANVFRLTQTYVQPSRNDCTALALAIQENCPLLTGDANLKRAATHENVVVYGTLWLVEALVNNQIITKQQAHDAYDRMQQFGRRLPWPEAHHRIAQL